MRLPTTIKGYISLIKQIELIDCSSLKGFEDLSTGDQETLLILDAEISNQINELNPSNPCKENS